MKTVLLEIENNIAQVFLNRPEHSNSIVLETFRELISVGEQLKRNHSLRAVILTGKGKHFCAGLDRSLFPKKPGTVDWFEQYATISLETKRANIFQRCVTIWQELSIPVIAAVNGAALGGGCQIALGADIRIGDSTTRMSLMETYWGLIPDMAITQTLPQICSRDVAADLILTARKLNYQEAKEAGLVTRISEDCYGEALALAKHIASLSPDAIRAAKRLYQQAWKAAPELLSLEAQLQKELLGSPNQIACIKQNMANASSN